MEEDRKPKSAGRRRGPRKVTEKRLRNVALHYVARYAATTESLRRVLMRRVLASARSHGTDADEGAAWTEALIIRFQELGYLDDRAFAETRARALTARGLSLRAVRGRLRQKGVSADDIEAALEALTDEMAEPDLAAAAALARRRRLGPYRSDEVRPERRDKDLAALARAGFSYDIARRVIEADTVAELEDMAAAETPAAGPRYVADDV